MGYSGKNMTTTNERLNRLEDAHRALAAQHTALLETCKYMLPLISADPAILRSTLVMIYDSSNRKMAEGYDDDFRSDVRHWIDILCTGIAEHKPPSPASAPPIGE